MVKAGYVGIVGLANAGKSTLVNRLVGEKVAIVSPKPQTTRENIIGIVNGEDYQIVLVDTPGVHHSKNKLDKYMMKNVRSAIGGVDLVLYLIDGTKKPDEEETQYITKLKSSLPTIVVKTKIDKSGICDFECDFAISSLRGDGVDEVKQKIIEMLPFRENFLYDKDYYTTQSVRTLISEKLREECLNAFHDEIPHGIAVLIEKFEEGERLVSIDAVIVCEEERHKGIIIGKAGGNLKKLGQNCREYAESILDKKVYLKVFVKCEQDWRNRPDRLKNLGYD